MISKFYDKDVMKNNPYNSNATLLAINLTPDLFSDEGKYKASMATLIRFEVDSFFTDSYELIIQTGEEPNIEEIKLEENIDFFLGEEDVELGSPFKTALGVRLQDTKEVRKALNGTLILRAWVARQNLKARDLNDILDYIREIIKIIG